MPLRRRANAKKSIHLKFLFYYHTKNIFFNSDKQFFLTRKNQMTLPDCVLFKNLEGVEELKKYYSEFSLDTINYT